MNRLLKIVGRISDKGGKAKVFSLVLCSVFVLLLMFSVYSVFGDGISGAAVAGSGDEPSGVFDFCDKCLDGWKYVEGNKIITSNAEVTIIDNKLDGVYSFSPLRVKEDDKIVSVKDAISLKGYYEPVWLENDGVNDFQFIDWNWTSVSLKPYVKSVGSLNKDIPFKINGVQKFNITLTSLDVKNASIVIINANDFGIDSFMTGNNFSLGEHSTTVDFQVANNDTFRLVQIYWDPTFETFHAGNPNDMNTNGPYVEALYANITEFPGIPSTGFTFTNFTLEMKVKDIIADPDILKIQAFSDFGCANFSEYPLATGNNATWVSPRDNWQHPSDGSAAWTNGSAGAFKDTILYGDVWSGIPHNVDETWGGYDFKTSIIQQQYDDFGLMSVSLISNSESRGINFYPKNSGSNAPIIRITGFLNTVPSDPVVEMSPLDSFKNVDVYCVGSVNDSEGGTLTVDVEVFKNNVSQFLLINNSAFNNVDFNFTIDSANFSVGDEWGCGMRVYDQTDWSEWKNATQFTVIQNTAPYIDPLSNVTLTPSGSTGPDFDLTCTFNATDAENTSLIAYVDWYKDAGLGYETAVWNDMPVTSGIQASFKLENPGNTTIGDTWKCGITIFDGYSNSTQVNSSETEIVSIENKTDFTTQLQSLNVKDVFVYDTSKENWNRTDQNTNWYFAKYGTTSPGYSFPDKVYLFLTDKGLDIFDASSTNSVWMAFTNGSGRAIESTSDFTSVYALDGKIYVGSDKGLYILDFVNDNISKYDTSGLSYFNSQYPFQERNDNKGYTTPGGTGLASNGVNDIHVNRVKGKHLIAVATDGSSVGGVNVIDMGDGSVATLRFFGTQANFDSDSVVIADDGTLYYSENNVVNPSADNNKLSYKYSVESYNGSSSNGDGYYASKGSIGTQSSNVTIPHFPTLARITNIYVTSYTSRMHDNHNTVYVATEKGVSVIQEVQGNEGVGGCKLYGFTGSTNSELDYKVLAGSSDNVTAVVARSDGNAMYAGTNSGVGAGSVSEISLNSNSLVGSWNKETDLAIVGNDTTSLDFLDGDLLVGTLDSGATQIVKHELDHYLITDHTNHRVVEIDNTGLIHWEFGVYGTAGNDTTHLTYPTYAVRHDDGNYLIADSGNRRILEVNSDREVIQQISNLTQLSDATFLGEVYSVQKITRT